VEASTAPTEEKATRRGSREGPHPWRRARRLPSSVGAFATASAAARMPPWTDLRRGEVVGDVAPRSGTDQCAKRG
jgi:hypothetical protein